MIFALLFVAGFSYINYGTDLTIGFTEKYVWTNKIIPFHLVIYAIPLLLGYLIQSFSHKDWSYWKNPKFILLCLFALALFSIRASSHLFLQGMWDLIQDWPYSRWYYSIFSTIFRGGLLFIPIGIYWYLVDRKKMNFYGFTLKNFNTRPYFVMLAIMLPLIILASTQGDFQGAYPRGVRFRDLSIDNPDHRWFFIVYELFYGLDFFSIEFFFRGFMVLAFIGVVGPRAIIPMAMFYVVIHYGKPAGELVSSFFGGTLLGIIAYYSKSIIGGIIVHVGIAWMMEIGAFIGNMLSS